MTDVAEIYELQDELHYYFRYSYGGISHFFREIVERQQLHITRCPRCDQAFCPPRADCPTCWERTTWEPHTGDGVVVSPVYCFWTQVNSPVRRYTQPPFVYALVRLDGVENALHSLVHTLDPRPNHAVRVGTRVEVRFREDRRGEAADFYFVPVEDPIGGELAGG
jgi:uncharacterized OB-fold protein